MCLWQEVSLSQQTDRWKSWCLVFADVFGLWCLPNPCRRSAEGEKGIKIDVNPLNRPSGYWNVSLLTRKAQSEFLCHFLCAKTKLLTLYERNLFTLKLMPDSVAKDGLEVQHGSFLHHCTRTQPWLLVGSQHRTVFILRCVIWLCISLMNFPNWSLHLVTPSCNDQILAGAQETYPLIFRKTGPGSWVLRDCVAADFAWD